MSGPSVGLSGCRLGCRGRTWQMWLRADRVWLARVHLCVCVAGAGGLSTARCTKSTSAPASAWRQRMPSGLAPLRPHPPIQFTYLQSQKKTRSSDVGCPSAPARLRVHPSCPVSDLPIPAPLPLTQPYRTAAHPPTQANTSPVNTRPRPRPRPRPLPASLSAVPCAAS